MTAPDKIYVSNLIYGSWQYTIPDPDDETEVEYLRKDALLEWVKEKANDYKGTANIRRSFELMIKKIESL